MSTMILIHLRDGEPVQRTQRCLSTSNQSDLTCAISPNYTNENEMPICTQEDNSLKKEKNYSSGVLPTRYARLELRPQCSSREIVGKNGCDVISNKIWMTKYKWNQFIQCLILRIWRSHAFHCFTPIGFRSRRSLFIYIKLNLSTRSLSTVSVNAALLCNVYLRIVPIVCFLLWNSHESH